MPDICVGISPFRRLIARREQGLRRGEQTKTDISVLHVFASLLASNGYETKK